MPKIKYINCFGTSFTAGGGFEFDGQSTGRGDFLKSYYADLDVPQTQFSFSYPGQLQRVAKTIKVTNYAKNGYGNDRMMRLVYEIVSNPNFNKDEHIFLIEFGGMGRRELWYEPLNDFIITNYWIDWDTHKLKEKVDIAHSYCYDTHETETALEKEESLFLEFYTKTFNLDKEVKKYQQDTDFFIAYLDVNQINYFIINDTNKHNTLRNFEYGDGVYFKQSTDFNRFTNLNKLELDIETKGLHRDKHNGYVSNKIVGETIYNRLIDKGFIDGEKVEIDYEGLRKLKLPKRNMI